ncbi:MAG: sterol desaturase family protein, partial [Bdellovibrionaceae bacterium]|nr:sterol desaturase family protein [Pseudobdellovibrionaceae bacterium]
MIGLGVYLIPFVTLILLKKHFGYSKMYTDIGEYGVAYIVLTILVFTVFTDTYSYWFHRAQHKVKLLKSTHIVHHKSINISPLSGYSFSLADA